MRVLGYLMQICYQIIGNYGVAIIIFTLISKIILLPVSVWVQKNSIKMVKMQPEINRLKIKYFGDNDHIADGQSAIFKTYKYNPFASTIPLVVQLLLLMGLIEVIYHPLNYILGMDETLITTLITSIASMSNLDVSASTIQLSVVAAIQDGAVPVGVASNVIDTISKLDLSFLGFNIAHIPSMTGGANLWSPVMAGLSAWLLCEAQNRSNVLQSEQNKWNKYGMMAFSIGLSLYLGYFVPIGVGLYWTASNILAIAQLYLLNWWINPKKYVDYAALEESKKQLAALNDMGEKHKMFSPNPHAKREKKDYKRFFSIANKHLVFYSESSGFYKYYKGIIDQLLTCSNVTIHYITSDPDDAVFQLSTAYPKLKPYYIGQKKLITLMMKMDADIVVMTMPDLENMHIKRSYLRKDIEYIYVPHGMDSLNMTMRTGSVDHYDTVLCVGPHQKEEIYKTESAYNLTHKNLVEWGYSLLDDMRAEYQTQSLREDAPTRILIAPSWQEDNIIDSCLEQLLESLLPLNHEVIVRPHPQQVKRYHDKMEQLKKRYESHSNITIQTDFSSNRTVFEADLLITDWSAVAFEFAYTTLRPVLFINTPMKVMNSEYQKIDTVPINILLRKEIGKDLDISEVSQAGNVINQMLLDKALYENKIEQFVQQYVYNLGHSGEVAAKYILSSLKKPKQQ